MYQVDGKQYGIPFDIGMVGFWYNKDLFAKAGITAPPATWDELLDRRRKLKAAGITPIAAGRQGQVARRCSTGRTSRCASAARTRIEQAAIDTVTGASPSFVKAGEQLKQLVDLKPFQKGFLGAAYGRRRRPGRDDGQRRRRRWSSWASGLPARMAASSPGKKGIGDKLGWFPFPAVDGGKGAATDAFGGGNGFAVGKDAPPEAIDFLKYLVEPRTQPTAGAPLNGGILPTSRSAPSRRSPTRPARRSLAGPGQGATFVQLYLDQATTRRLGSAINDAVASSVAGSGTPEQVTQAITDAPPSSQ